MVCTCISIVLTAKSAICVSSRFRTLRMRLSLRPTTGKKAEAFMSLVPQTMFQGPALEFDFPAMQVGVAEYAEGPTGCTIFLFSERVATSIDCRGGGAGTVGDYERNHAIC